MIQKNKDNRNKLKSNLEKDATYYPDLNSMIPSCDIISLHTPATSETKNIITNSGKYAHYAHGLSGRHTRLSNLQDCVEAAIAGFTTRTSPGWL